MESYFRLLSLLSLSLILSNPALPHDQHGDLRHWEIASRDPDRIFLTFYGDSATSRAVTWRTDTRVTEAEVQLALSTASPKFDKYARIFPAKTETIDLQQYAENKQGKVNYHSAILDSLDPDTLYAYRVGDGNDVWSEWIQFRTAKTAYAPFSFVYFGDAQNSILSHWSRVIRMAYQKAPHAMFAIHAGDLINRAHKDLEWAQWFKAGGWIHAQWTGVPVLGNHEFGSIAKGSNKTVSLHWRPQFTLPVETSLPEDLHETVYAFDYQQVRVIVLNSIINPEAQTKYLAEKLKEPGAKWKIVTCHYSIFSPAKGRDFPYARQEWKPLLDRYGVDLVLQGHDHTYARGQVPVRTFDGGDDKGLQTLYVTSVSGAKMYETSPSQLESYAVDGYYPIKTAEQKQFFQVIDIKDSKLTYRAFTADGKKYDQAVITKDFKTGRKILE